MSETKIEQLVGIIRIRETLCNLIVCVPSEMKDSEIEAKVLPSGTQNGWRVDNKRKDVRIQCANDKNRQHVVLAC